MCAVSPSRTGLQYVDAFVSTSRAPNGPYTVAGRAFPAKRSSMPGPMRAAETPIRSAVAPGEVTSRRAATPPGTALHGSDSPAACRPESTSRPTPICRRLTTLALFARLAESIKLGSIGSSRSATVAVPGARRNAGAATALTAGTMADEFDWARADAPKSPRHRAQTIARMNRSNGLIRSSRGR